MIMVKILKNPNLISYYICVIFDEVIQWYMNKTKHENERLESKKIKKVSFDENIKIRIITNIEETITKKEKIYHNYNSDQIVRQSLEQPKIEILDNNDDFDFFVYFG